MEENNIRDQLKEALKVIFDFSYKQLFEEFSQANVLSSEADFISYLLENQKEHLKEIRSQIDFFFNSAVNTDSEYQNIVLRDEFWFYKEYYNYLNNKLRIIEALSPQPIKTKAEILKEQLNLHGFSELEKVKILSEQSKVSIIEKIAESGLPYAIAMFDFLQFIQHLEKNHFDSKDKLNKEVSKWFSKDKDGRSVKGNISSLLENTTENKNRYTAHKHKEQVIKDYEQLK